MLAGWAPVGLLDTYDAERRPVGAWVLDWPRAQIGVLRGDAKSAALRRVVGDLLNTRDGTTYAVKKIAGVTQRIELPGDHPLVGRFVPDLWCGDGSRLIDHGHTGEGSCCSTAHPTARSPAEPPHGPGGRLARRRGRRHARTFRGRVCVNQWPCVGRRR